MDKTNFLTHKGHGWFEKLPVQAILETWSAIHLIHLLHLLTKDVNDLAKK
jgi:hypothetical protein